jgi:hypothetical protein
MARAGGDKRGSSGDRKRRREWLVSPVAGFGGNGSEVPCFWKCGRELDVYTVEADRVIPGGSYRRENIVPACRPCNLARSDDANLTVDEIAERVAATAAKRGGLVPALVG